MRKHLALAFVLFTAAFCCTAPARAADPPDCVTLAKSQANNGVVLNSGAISVTRSPATAWQPRGGEVRFNVKATAAPASVQVCFTWPNTPDTAQASPQVRRLSPADGGSADLNTVTYAAIVPSNLVWAPTGWWDRVSPFSNAAASGSDGFGTVPLLTIIVGVALTADDTAHPMVFYPRVGITFLPIALGVVAALLAAIFGVVWAWKAKVKKKTEALGAAERHDTVSSRYSGLLLWLITGQDGFASLSQLQIVLWTLVVAASAVYVMALNGTLVNISDGTLILLGIAGGAATVARVPPRTALRSEKRSSVFAAEWSDIVVIDGVVDVTRVQMLLFTLVCAGFVLLKVIVGYEIPEIPTNFTLLMGITNGVYLAGRSLKDTGSTTG